MDKKISIIKLFWIFFKIGTVLFGGGYAILPFLKSEIVEKENICTLEELTDLYAVSQCFPGLVAGNISMFIGYKARGIAGAFGAVTGVCLPAFLSIVLIFAFLSSITQFNTVQNIFTVLNIAVCILILLTVMEMWSFSVTDKFTGGIFIISLVASVMKISPFVIVILAGSLGLIRYLCIQKNTVSQKECDKK